MGLFFNRKNKRLIPNDMILLHEADDEKNKKDKDEEEDFTAGINNASEDESNDDNNNENTSSDNDVQDNETSDNTNNNEEEDFTAGVNDASEDESNDADDSESDETDDSTDDTENEEDNSEDIKNIEAELFSNLTPEQIAIRNTTLKNNYIELYKTIGSVLVRINDIPKTDNNNTTLQYITEKLLELRDMVDFNITVAYNTRTYIENNIIYQQCLSTLNAISDIMYNLETSDKNIADMKTANDIEDDEQNSIEDDESDNINNDLSTNSEDYL